MSCEEQVLFAGREPVALWPAGAPRAMGSQPSDIPALSIYLPAQANGSSVLVCPGGAYCHLAHDHEGRQIAEWLNALGVAAFVLRYRVAPYAYPVPLLDAQRALRTVRAGSAAWNLNPARIGVWGFSAGGHLASTLSTHYDAGDANAVDPIERVSCRPDFTILNYPVITMTDTYSHAGSKIALLGESPDPALVELLSNERQVTPETPPAFLIHTDDDPVPAENSTLYYLAMRRAGVPAELHIYQRGGHGYGLAQHDPALSDWPDLLRRWLERQQVLPVTS